MKKLNVKRYRYIPLRMFRVVKYYLLYLIKKDKVYLYEAEHNFYSKGFVVK